MILMASLSAVLVACAAQAQPVSPSDGPPGSQPGPPGSQPGPPGSQPGQGPSPLQPAVASPTLTADPAAAIGAPVQWTLVFPANFCGGPHFGGFVQLLFEPPLPFPPSIPSGRVASSYR